MGSLVSLLLSFKCLCILDNSPLSGVFFANIFFQTLTSNSLDTSFAEHKFFNFGEMQFARFSFYGAYF